MKPQEKQLAPSKKYLALAWNMGWHPQQDIFCGRVEKKGRIWYNTTILGFCGQNGWLNAYASTQAPLQAKELPPLGGAVKITPKCAKHALGVTGQAQGEET